MSDDQDEIERIGKAPARYAFYVDVGKVSPEKAQEFLKKVKGRFKGKNFKNPLDNDNDTFN